MDASLPTTTPAALARELYVMLAELQDSRPVPLDQIGRWIERASSLARDLTSTSPTLAEVITRCADRLSSVLHKLRAGAAPGSRLTVGIAQQYEALARLLRRDDRTDGVELPELKPRNLARNLFHIGNGLLSGTLYTLFPDRKLMLLIAWAYTGAMLFTDLIRRTSPKLNRWLMQRVFGAIARPGEAHRMSSATWYGIAVILIVYAFSPAACIAAVLILGVGDPIAANVGRRWGNHKLVGNKSLEGTLAFFGSATLVCTAFFALTRHPEIAQPGALATWLGALRVGAAAAAAGALVELVSKRLEDNFTIPVVAAAAASLVL
jgi:dolichol kinase